MNFINFTTNLIKLLFKGPGVSSKTLKLVETTLVKARNVVQMGDMSSKKSIIMELDLVLGQCLKDIYKQQSLAENLKKAKARFNKEEYNKVWIAHKTRNKIVHEPNLILKEQSLDFAIYNLIKGIKGLI